MVSSCMKRCSASPIIRELQIKTRYIISYPLECQKDRNNQCRRGCRVKETLMHWWWECKLVHPLWKTLQRFLKNLKLKLLVYYDPAAGCLFTLLIVSFVVPKNVRCSLTCLFLLWLFSNLERDLEICLSWRLLVEFIRSPISFMGLKTKYQRVIQHLGRTWQVCFTRRLLVKHIRCTMSFMKLKTK